MTPEQLNEARAVENLAGELDRSPAEIRRALANLEARGLITRTASLRARAQDPLRAHGGDSDMLAALSAIGGDE